MAENGRRGEPSRLGQGTRRLLYMHTYICANDEAAVYTVERRAVTVNSYLPPDLQGAKGVCSGERNVLSHCAPAEPHSLSPTKVEQISSAWS